MKITKHISFFYIETRINYINRIIDETNNYCFITDIFIHTNNKELQESVFNKYTNGTINIIYHDLSNEHPYYLTWKCRDLLKKQRYDYDIFMYIEDDILVPNNAITYWLEYNEKLIEKNYNLGFLRIELENDIEYITDFKNQRLDTVLQLDNVSYIVNNLNQYCAFWIYNKNEFNKFVDSVYFDLSKKSSGFRFSREESAMGLHGVGSNNVWYKNSIIPMTSDKLHEYCKIYHMPNNYVMDKNSQFGTIKFNEAIKDNRKIMN